MKKFLMIAAMVAMVAAPAMAGMVPFSSAGMDHRVFTDYQIKNVNQNPAYGAPSTDRGLIGTPYVPNDPAAVFDNKSSFFFSGPQTSGWWFGSSFPAGIIYWDDFAPVANTTALTELKWDYFVASGVTSTATHTQFFKVTTGTALAPNLNSSGFVFSFSLFGLPLSGPAVWSVPIDLGFLGVGAIPANTQLWFGWTHFSGFGNPTLSGGLNPVVNGNPGDGNPTAFYVGDAGLRSCTQSGSSLSCTSLTVPGLGPIHNVHLAFNGVPEPSVIGLLALGGVLALRRRKA